MHRMTLSKMINQQGYNTGTENLDRLCKYFDCAIEELAEYIAEVEVSLTKINLLSGFKNHQLRNTMDEVIIILNKKISYNNFIAVIYHYDFNVATRI
ncbi:MAG: helix-turn-helix transcriptional regulator [Pseudomonadales bacterium]|nr:helix-turn-helix transcriptional regulator [Pseudomonadales bacterium]